MDITNYLSDSIKVLIAQALNAKKLCLREKIFLFRYKKSSVNAAILRKKYEENGLHIPPFLIASITSRCNLFCNGCYARANKSCGENIKTDYLSDNRLDELFFEAEDIGINFILLAGGEPLMRKEILIKASKHKKILFPVFTNGTLFDDYFSNMFNKSRNLLPILSIEGNESTTDKRRGKGVYQKIIFSIHLLNKKKIFFGASITVTKNNIDDVTSKSFVDKFKKYGCGIFFYIEYVPNDQKDEINALTDKEREILDKNITYLKKENGGCIFISFPGDEKLLEGCLAAGRGFFHISVNGNAEPCPFSPYSDINLKEHSIKQCLSSPLFNKIKSSDFMLEPHTGGCLLHMKEKEVQEIIRQQNT